ncbi:MAG: hypothetical protein IH881_10165 [Myxococcales bacterium]|nr:hypothetical protein [Myxococcales bacterium]
MPPHPLCAAAPVRVRRPLSLRHKIAAIGIATLFACSIVAGSAAADASDESVKSQRVVRYRPSLVPPKVRQRPALLPQTRYTVRKQIESIEPISWLKRYGEVQVRKIKR